MEVVSYIAKIRFFEQITTTEKVTVNESLLFLILQRYDFSSKSQLFALEKMLERSCFLYCKDTIFRANHNGGRCRPSPWGLFLILQRYDFSSKSQLVINYTDNEDSCFLYCKDTIFRANHNWQERGMETTAVVSYIAKIRFFEQITTL